MISLKIENIFLNNLLQNNKDLLFKEGSILNGKILSLIDEIAIIEVKGHGTVQARIETDLKMNLNDEISFLVKSAKGDVINLKPLLENDKIQTNLKENNSISKLLQSINIKETKLSIGLVESLMKYNIPITEQKINEGIKILEKLSQLINVNEDEKVVLISPNMRNTDIINNNTQNEANKTNETNQTTEKSIMELSEGEVSIPVEKEDIRFMLVSNKDNYSNMKEISSIVKEYLGDEINNNIKMNTMDEGNVIDKINVSKEEGFLKLTSFLIKNNIKPSLNNIKNLKDLNNNPIEFAKNLKEINSLIKKSEKNQLDKVFVDTEKETVTTNYLQRIDKELGEIEKLIRNTNDNSNLQQKNELKNLENKIDFLKDLNKDLSFVFLPIHHRKEDLEGVLAFLKDKRNKKGSSEKTNVFINLNTNNLGKIRISCQLTGDLINAKISINKEDLELFKSAEKILVEKISSFGYILNKIEFITDDFIQIVDLLVSNPNPTYILDLKV